MQQSERDRLRELVRRPWPGMSGGKARRPDYGSFVSNADLSTILDAAEVLLDLTDPDEADPRAELRRLRQGLEALLGQRFWPVNQQSARAALRSLLDGGPDAR